MFRKWFKKKILRKQIGGDFSMTLLPLINVSTKELQSIRRRCDRILGKDITDLSVAELITHIEIIRQSIDDSEGRLMNCNNLIIRERER